MDDWVGEEANDLLSFTPVDWTIDIDLAQYEIFLFTNRYNWLDVLGGGAENTKLAFCGSTGHISFHLPFTEYIPVQQKIHFSAKVSLLVVYVQRNSLNAEVMGPLVCLGSGSCCEALCSPVKCHQRSSLRTVLSK